MQGKSFAPCTGSEALASFLSFGEILQSAQPSHMGSTAALLLLPCSSFLLFSQQAGSQHLWAKDTGATLAVTRAPTTWQWRFPLLSHSRPPPPWCACHTFLLTMGSAPSCSRWRSGRSWVPHFGILHAVNHTLRQLREEDRNGKQHTRSFDR